MHLNTRCAQLEVVTTLELLWNEVFRIMEDFNSIVAASKRSPKAKLMVTSYDKLTNCRSSGWQITSCIMLMHGE